MELTKHHGLGNDFLVAIGPAEGPFQRDRLGDLAVALCDRHRGVGADGLILAEPTDPATAGGAELIMHLYNADGTRAEMSGNGIRCLAQAAAMAADASSSERVVNVATDAGLRILELGEGSGPHEVQVTVEMGEVADGPPVPVAVSDLLDDELGPVRLATADVGNPHLVVEVADPQAIDLGRLGPRLEAAFPGGCNIQLISAAEHGALTLRVWERGVGLTQACGTGACAAAHVATGWGLGGERVRVDMPGGSAHVRLEGSRAILTGPAVYVAAVEVPDV